MLAWLAGLAPAIVPPATAQPAAPQRAEAQPPSPSPNQSPPSAGVGKIDMSQAPAPASGMWTSRVPAKNGAYRYPLLIIGVIIATITALLLVRTLRRAGQERATR